VSPGIDLTRAPTAPFEAGEEHALLATFVGLWTGPTQLWLEPSGPPEVTSTLLHAEPVLGGRWLRVSYQGVTFGKPHAGEMLLGFHKDAREVELAWIDSAHTGSAIMLSKGKLARPGIIDVLGSYAAGEQRWGWRTILSCPSPGELVIQSFNISPQGEEERAMESRLTRSQQSAG
jgi:hypothetical protein